VIEPFHDLHFKAGANCSFPALFIFGIMDGKPDRRMIPGPSDTVFYARRNENVVAFGQNLDVGLAFKRSPADPAKTTTHAAQG
jgi:hypothetical protein